MPCLEKSILEQFYMKAVVWLLVFPTPSLCYSFACDPDAELLWMFSHISVGEKFNVIC